MNRTTLLTTLGGAALALTLASGVGLVIAQNGPPAKVSESEARVPVVPAPNEPQPSKPAPEATRRYAAEQLEKLERFAATLKSEMTVAEKEIQLFEREGGVQGDTLAELQKQLAEVNTAIAANDRELIRSGAEMRVLEKPNAQGVVDVAGFEAAKLQVAIKKEVRGELQSERDAVRMVLHSIASSSARIDQMRKALEVQREMLAKVQAQLLLLRAHREGITFTDQTATGADTKLDTILKELVALRKEVQELKRERK